MSHLSLKEERAKENIRHRYSLWFLLVRVGVVVLFLPVIMITKSFRPLYEVVDVVAIAAAGMILGAVYVIAESRLAKRYTRKLAELGEKTD